MSAPKKLILLDAMALVYRAFYALMNSPRITSDGKNTNAQFGFTNTLNDILKKEQPSHIAVVWDTHAPTERHTDFTDYKANRQEAPEDLLNAIPDIKAIVKAFNIANLELDGYEADDIVGTIALQAGAQGYEVYMVTPDKDYGQLVRDNVFIYKPGYKGGTYEILGPKEVCEKWGIQSVHQVVDMLGLMGDAADNIPGIPGVGEKTAAKLLAEYHTLENVLDNAASIKGKLGEKVLMGKESAILSKKLATIIIDVPVAYSMDQLQYAAPDEQALNDIFGQLEFRTLAKRILGYTSTLATAAPTIATNTAPVQADLFGNAVSNGETIVAPEATIYKTIKDVAHQYHLIEGVAAIRDWVAVALQQTNICFDTETTSIDAMLADVVGMSFAWNINEAYYIPFPQDEAVRAEYLEILGPLFAKETILWIGQNIKYDLLILKKYGYDLVGPIFDTMVAHYVIAPEGKRNMDLLSMKYLNYEPISIETLIGKKGKNQLNMKDIPVANVLDYAAEDADVTLQLKHVFEPLLEAENVKTLFDEVDNPLVKILAEVEFEGVAIDVPFLQQFSTTLGEAIKQAEESVYEQAGVRFNLASPKQLGEVLFDKMQLDPKAKKTKTGQYATGEDVLIKLRTKHQIVDDILKFREFSKLKSTYADALPLMVNPMTGKIHTSYNQTIVATGRLSSNNPNLQNIPIKTENGKEIRKAFIPSKKEHILLSADYSQIELRVVAAVSGDESLIKAFQEGKDIHKATAAKVYGVAEDEVTSTMRRNAKAVNFGIIYGQSAFGLADSLGISRGEAKEIIDNYFREYSAIKTYMDTSIAYAKANGYVKTLMGRKIKLADINSSNATVRSFAERLAINAPIQGSAADMIKLAMIKIAKALPTSGLRAKMIMQVHDELVFDVHQDDAETLKNLVVEHMQSAMLLPNNVPVIAEAGTGTNWLDAH